MKLLHIDASILGVGSVSRELTALIVKRLIATKPAEITYRDLAAENLPHATAATLPTAHRVAAMAGVLDRDAQAIRDTSDRMLAEFLAADTVVIGAPMYNFTIPSQLKAWVDRVIVAGQTFNYGTNGVEGMAVGKRVILALARGGVYGPEAAMASAEHAESYLRTVFGFIGITDLVVVVAEGLAFGEQNRNDALASARTAIETLAA